MDVERTVARERGRSVTDLTPDEPEQALSALEAQLPAAEESADLHRAIGLACYRLGDLERAFSELSTAYDLTSVREALRNL